MTDEKRIYTDEELETPELFEELLFSNQYDEAKNLIIQKFDQLKRNPDENSDMLDQGPDTFLKLIEAAKKLHDLEAKLAVATGESKSGVVMIPIPPQLGRILMGIFGGGRAPEDDSYDPDMLN